MSGQLSKVSASSSEAAKYFNILGTINDFRNPRALALRALATLPTSEVYTFVSENQEVVGGVLLSHFSTTLSQKGNFNNWNRLNTFGGLHSEGHKYLSYLAVDEQERGKGYADLMWDIKRKFYLVLLEKQKEEKLERMGCEVVLDQYGEPLNSVLRPDSLYFKVDNTR